MGANWPTAADEQQAASSHDEVGRPGRGQDQANPPAIAPQSSAGSTPIPTVRQDKRAADMMEFGEPTKRSNRLPLQPKDVIVQKWREGILLQQQLKDLRAAGAAELLSDHVARAVKNTKMTTILHFATTTRPILRLLTHDDPTIPNVSPKATTVLRFATRTPPFIPVIFGAYRRGDPTPVQQ